MRNLPERTAMPKQEILDLVDDNDNVIGTATRDEIYAKKSTNYRAVFGLLINDKGQLWIPRRHSKKKLYPSCLDSSIGGCVSSGETYEQALIREGKEELNLDVETIGYTLLAHLTPRDHGMPSFGKVFGIPYNQDPPFNHDDFIEGFWISPQDLLKKIAQEPAVKKSLAVIITHLTSTGISLLKK